MNTWRSIMTLLGAGTVALACAGGEESADNGAPSSGAGGASCEEQCHALHPAGATEYEAFRLCLLCEACHDACASAECSGTQSESGCSAGASSCSECVASSCAAAQGSDLIYTGACAPEANACAGKIVCVQLSNCISDCLTSGT